MMILTAHQPVYLPWLGLFHKIALADAFCYFDDVQYQNKDFNNRNRIKGPNGPFWLTVPVKSKGHYQIKVKDAEIIDNDAWRKKHWKSILSCYRQAPFFSRYADYFENVYQQDWQRLSDLNEHLLKYFLQELGIRVTYFKMSELKIEGHKSDLVLDMCLNLNASAYIFGALGRDYADIPNFKTNGVRTYIQDYRHPEYPQLFEKFESHLSIIDLFFNCGPDSLDILMSGNITRDQLNPQTFR